MVFRSLKNAEARFQGKEIHRSWVHSQGVRADVDGGWPPLCLWPNPAQVWTGSLAVPCHCSHHSRYLHLCSELHRLERWPSGHNYFIHRFYVQDFFIAKQPPVRWFWLISYRIFESYCILSTTLSLVNTHTCTHKWHLKRVTWNDQLMWVDSKTHWRLLFPLMIGHLGFGFEYHFRDQYRKPELISLWLKMNFEFRK